MLAPVIHILPLTLIRRERVLPVPGRILVRKGQKVGANDVVVEAKLYPEHLLLDIAVGLGVSRSQTERHIQVKPGDQLADGDIVAGPVGFGRRVVRAPRNCQVILVGSDQVLLELIVQPFQVKAGMSGEVVELISDRGAIIETTGALVQGVWGNGRVDYGMMTVLAKEPEQGLMPEQFDVSMRGAMVMGACCENMESLHAAQELPIRGLILASMSIDLKPVAARMEYPIILLEGFGNRGMNSLAFKLLSTSERREVSINAQEWHLYEGKRPEIVIPLPSDGEISQPHDAEEFSKNLLVRVVRAPHAGKVGRLVRMCGSVTFTNGISALAAEVQLEDGDPALLPLANLEVIA